MFVKERFAEIILLFLFLLAAVLIINFRGPRKGTGQYANSISDSVDVVHYTVNLDILDFNRKEISGFTDLQIVLKKDNLNQIVVDLLSLIVDSIWIDEIKITDYSYDGSKIIIPLSTALPKGRAILISVFYHGKPSKDPRWGGFYFGDGYAYNMGIGMKSDPHSYGRCWYPCFDNFIDRATYDYFITVGQGFTAVCSGTLAEIFENKNGTITYHWNLKNSIPVYLSSVSVSNYIALKDTFIGIRRAIPSQIYVSPEDSLLAVHSFKNLGEYLRAFEYMFGPYPWERIGFVSVPFTGGAMEHATNIAVSETAINGTLDSEMLFVHEFAHNWFGNLVTCQSAEDMWLNEGWASYCEALFLEYHYGKQRFKDYVRENHKKVLSKTHIRDKGYRAVYGIPHEFTYGSTVYDKGFDVVHTLRSYLGDKPFFSSLKKYFEYFAFKDISTELFKNFLTMETKLDLTDFFNTWIYSPGFPHFSIDSFLVNNAQKGFETRVFIRQKLKGTDDYAYSNKIEVTFMDEHWHALTETFEFSGETGVKLFYLPFEPDLVMLDLEEKINDATTDNYKVIRSKGKYEFKETYFEMQVEDITDSAFIRVELNWVAPDSCKKPKERITISNSNYWKIEGIFPDDFNVKGIFSYDLPEFSLKSWVDSVFKGRTYTMVLLYRSNLDDDWDKYDFKLEGNEYFGKLVIDSLRSGEYTLGFLETKLH
jgi:aminopeptidase N